MDFSYEEGLKAISHLQNRQSVRSYEDRPIDPDLLEKILDVGLHAASGGNLQPFTFILERDNDRKDKLCSLCGNQKFIANAPVNLILLIDWHKLEVYAKHNNAPFIANRSYKHFLTAIEDAMCAIQSIESAAWLCGVGSCFVFSSNYSANEIIRMYNLPKHTFPILLMSMGYMKTLTPKRPKMARNLMVCEGSYNISDEQIISESERLTGNRKMYLPQDKDARNTLLNKFEDALYTTFNPYDVSDILEEVKKCGYLNDPQRAFGSHYNAKDIYEKGKDVLKMLEEQDLIPWEALD